MSSLTFEAIVIKIEGNKVCRVYLKDDEEKRPIIGYLKERVTSDKKQRLKNGDLVQVVFSENDSDRCMVVKKIILEQDQNMQNKKNFHNKRRKKFY